MTGGWEEGCKLRAWGKLRALNKNGGSENHKEAQKEVCEKNSRGLPEKKAIDCSGTEKRKVSDSNKTPDENRLLYCRNVHGSRGVRRKEVEKQRLFGEVAPERGV